MNHKHVRDAIGQALDLYHDKDFQRWGKMWIKGLNLSAEYGDEIAGWLSLPSTPMFNTVRRAVRLATDYAAHIEEAGHEN